MAYLVVILTLCAASTIKAVEPVGGFIGTRGKRSISNEKSSSALLPPTIEPISTNSLNNDTQYRHLPEYPEYLSHLPELSIFKRAPVGFMGMRGKKDYEYSGFSRNELSDNSLDDNSPDKTLLLNNPNRLIWSALNPKRAPSGFMGMRGKKYYDDQSSQFDDDLMYLNDLQNERNSLSNNYPLYDDVINEDGYIKRAPSSGFMGMRGKRMSSQDDFSDSDWLEKRAPTGFLGMRGKRYYEDYDKRAPTGFMGMRGKRGDDFLDDITDEIEKRSGLAQFFGIRGKKQPLNSGFFGMRGKKEPFQFRGKFVGVRGKKIPDGSLRRLEFELNDKHLQHYNDDIDDNVHSSTNYLSEDAANNAIKRAPSGFMGMRGKKWPGSSLYDE